MVFDFLRLLALALVSVVASCTCHSNEDDFDVEKLCSISSEFLNLGEEVGLLGAQWWPKEIVELNSKEIRKTKKGVYIQIRSWFSEESGLYIPVADAKVEIDDSSDPSYRQLCENVYSCHIKG
ncbi:hypothetical protein ACJJIF_21460 [Microbulbifer sp. SSSA002]|uniref:hypothetical protein n=1 Tax=unclassified Microbulbifer TaxID=2619833 RepID=UPI004039B521